MDFQHEVIDRLARIEQKIEDKDKDCASHDRRIVQLEEAVGKQNVLAATIGALGTGLVLIIKALMGSMK